MLFNKNILPVPPQNSPYPIYVLGLSSLGLYLACRLRLAGNRVILLSSPDKAEYYARNDISLKEDRSLHARRLHFETAYRMRETPQLLIIASGLLSLRADLSLVSPSKLKETPVMNFSLQEDTTALADFLRTPIIQSYYHGFFNTDKNQLTAFGSPGFISVSIDEEDDRVANLRSLFSQASLDLKADNDNRRNFWNYIIPFMVSSLVSAAAAKNIYAVTKEESGRTLIDSCITELSVAAANEQIILDHNDLLRRIYNTPPNFSSSLQNALKLGDSSSLNDLAAVFHNLAGRTRGSFPSLRRLLKDIYDKTLA